MEKIKQMLKSRTVWAGIIQIVTSLSLFFTGEQTSHELLFGASGILMIVFRLITTESIGAKK
jgi:hypothetical protein